MACACNANKNGGQQTWVVTLPGGVRKTYNSEVEAAGAAQRGGGTYRKG